jgi:hypothetical protein
MVTQRLTASVPTSYRSGQQLEPTVKALIRLLTRRGQGAERDRAVHRPVKIAVTPKPAGCCRSFIGTGEQTNASMLSQAAPLVPLA